MSLTWSQFCKEPLPDRNFTFWEWFFAVMKVSIFYLLPKYINVFACECLLLEKKINGKFYPENVSNLTH